ncbi:MAG: hypothetical protein WC942_08810 [Clostridia bacterium]|jgi:hypothetical protein
MTKEELQQRLFELDKIFLLTEGLKNNIHYLQNYGTDVVVLLSRADSLIDEVNKLRRDAFDEIDEVVKKEGETNGENNNK